MGYKKDQRTFFYSPIKLRIRSDPQNLSFTKAIDFEAISCSLNFHITYTEPYELAKDTPMGSPISGYFAESVLQEFEATAFKTLKVSL